MKKIIITLFLLCIPCLAQGHDFTAQGGVIAKAGSSKLIAPNSGLIACGDTVNINTSVTGSFSLVTPTLTSGTFQTGGTFGAGGLVTLTASGQYCENFTGALDAGATWQLATLANGTHIYTLSGTLSNGAGAFRLVTVNIGKGFFSGAEGVSVVDLHLNQ